MIIDIAIEHETRISLAAIQNGLPAIRKLTLTNPSTHHIDDIEVEICLDPQLAPPKRVRIKRIWSNSVHVIEDLSIDISPASMQTLTEAIKGAPPHPRFDHSGTGPRRNTFRSEGAGLCISGCGVVACQ
jgi:hypothetical protein